MSCLKKTISIFFQMLGKRRITHFFLNDLIGEKMTM